MHDIEYYTHIYFTANSRHSERQEDQIKELRERYEKQLNSLKQELKQLQVAKREHAKAVKKNVRCLACYDGSHGDDCDNDGDSDDGNRGNSDGFSDNSDGDDDVDNSNSDGDSDNSDGDSDNSDGDCDNDICLYYRFNKTVNYVS